MNVTNKIPNNYKSNCLKLKQVQINEMPTDYGKSTCYNKHITHNTTQDLKKRSVKLDYGFGFWFGLDQKKREEKLE